MYLYEPFEDSPSETGESESTWNASAVLSSRVCPLELQKLGSQSPASRARDVTAIKETSWAGPHDNGSMALVFEGSK